MPPFNRELEDFAQAFSSGYSMSKSPQEREAERLQLESARFANERAPILAGQEDTLFGLEVEAKKGALTDAEAARERAKIVQAHDDAAWELDQQIRKNEISKQEYDAKRKVLDDAQDDQLHGLAVRKGTAEASQAEYLTSGPVRERAERIDEANISQSETITEGQRIKNEAERLGLKKLQNEATLWDSAINTVNSRKAAIPAVNQSRVIADPNAPSAEAVPEGPAPFVLRKPVPTVGPVIGGAPAAGGGLSVGATPQGPGLGPRAEEGAVEAPPVPANSPLGSGTSLGTFNPPLSDGELAPEPVPPPTAPTPTPPAPPATPPTEAVATRGAGAPALPVTEDARISYEDPKQRVIDNIVNGRPNQTPGGKSNMKAGAREAVKDGLGLLMQEHGMNDDYAVGTPEADNQKLGFLTGARAADPPVVKMVEDTIEEQVGEELSQNEKTYYTLATGWIYYNGIGDADAAKRYAASTLAHYQKAFSQYTAVMQAAASSGDIDGTMEAAVRAYANVPTGDELHLSWTKDKKHIIATVTDMDGKTTQKQLMTPEEMGAFAMNVDPSSFTTFIAQAAGRDKEEGQLSPAFVKAHPEAEGMTLGEYTQDRLSKSQGKTGTGTGAGKGGKKTLPASEMDTSPISADDLTTKETEVTTGFNNYLSKHGESWLPHLTPEEKQMQVDETLIPMTTTIALQNRGKGLTTQRVVRIVAELTKDKPAKWREIDEDTYGVTATNEPEIKISKDDFDALVLLRGQQQAEGFTRAEKARKSAAADEADNAEQQRISEEAVRRADERETAVPVSGEPAVPLSAGIGGGFDPFRYPGLPAQPPLPPLPVPPIKRPPPRRPAQSINLLPSR
jgi:hypothetical protein